MSSHLLVLDANIIIRAVLGKKVRGYLTRYVEKVDFFTPITCLEEVRKYLPILFEKKGLNPELALEVFSNVQCLLQVIDSSIYQERASEAQLRIKDRDFQDWPAVAAALVLKCPIWTEDQDFFGLGIPTWTTDRIHFFFNSIE